MDRTIRIWDICNGQCLKILQGHDRILASISLDHTVRLWDVPEGKCLRVLQGHTRWVLSVTFTTGKEFARDSGQVLASASDAQTIRSILAYRDGGVSENPYQ
ncbi:WD40 repeat domain-containing protein [Lyngbya aestuarii]|uniref:WD40 repeat domain-containing protein n=1 Tax=Lyngbya aestuarii TaxID=118322 RepID=UPI00403E2C30